MSNKKDTLSAYLDYLDKEMTIMGILSTFCIISAGFGVDKLILPDKDCQNAFWINTPFLCVVGVSGFLVSALSFYRQRAYLAWYYGQLSLYRAKEDEQKTQELLDNSDKWSSWIFYQAGFGFLFLGISELGLMFLSTRYFHIDKYLTLYSFLIFIFWFIIYLLKIISYLKYSASEKPEKELLNAIFKLNR